MTLKTELLAIIAAEPGLDIVQIYAHLLERRPIRCWIEKRLGMGACILLPTSIAVYDALADMEMEGCVMMLWAVSPGGRTTTVFYALERGKQ